MSNDRIHTYYAITVFPIVRPNLPNSRLIVMILLLIFIHFLIQGDYYIPCLKLPEEEQQPIGVWGQRQKIPYRHFSSKAQGVAFLRRLYVW